MEFTVINIGICNDNRLLFINTKTRKTLSKVSNKITKKIKKL